MCNNLLEGKSVFDVVKRIIELKENRNMNTYQFAKFTGVSQPYLSDIEKGNKGNSISIEKICAACGITLAEFFAGGDNQANIKASIIAKDKDDLLERVEKLKTEIDKIEKRLR
jgi:transcriptional regulator with XRE-family HTH domain